MPGTIKPTNIDKAWIAADPAAAVVGYGSTILAVFGVFAAIGLDADQVAILGGAVIGLMSSLRTLRERRQRRKMDELSERHRLLEVEHEELKRQTSTPEVGVPVSGSPGDSVGAPAAREGRYRLLERLSPQDDF
jgi:hypothetical protein